jgi:predicted nucleotidyltransferase
MQVSGRELESLKAEIGSGFAAVLGVRLTAVYVYGSGVDGSFIPGFSDLDLAVFCDGRPSLDELLRLHERLDVAIDPFSYLQVKYVDVTAEPHATLVPHSYEAVVGQLEDEACYVFTDEELLAEARRWVRVLPAIVIDDADAWSVSAGTARRGRHVRLLVTRVKPAVRSTLCLLGVTPSVAFAADWQQMADLMTRHDAESAALISRLRSLLPPADDEEGRTAGEVALKLLWRLAIDRPASETG